MTSFDATIWQRVNDSVTALQTRKQDMTSKRVYEEFPLLVPYRDFSRGGKSLAAALAIHYLRLSRGLQLSYSPPSLIVINWGNGKLPLTNSIPYKKVFNQPTKVSWAGDKLRFYSEVQTSVRIPTFTTKFETAMEWVESGQTVLGRTRRGSRAEGIVFFEDDPEGFTNSEFWVQYKKKKDEYRVHIAFGKVIDVQRKALRKTDHNGNPIDTTQVDFRIRNLAHGFVFVRQDITVPTDVIEQAMKAMEAIGLDFGAVDVIYNSTENKAYVLEINTAPGLEGTTVEKYANAFRPVLDDLLTRIQA